MNTRSISFRLVAWYAGWLAVIFLLLCALLYLDLRHFLEGDLRDSQLRRAHQIGDALLAHVKQSGEPYVASQVKDWYEPEVNDRFIRLTRADGTLVYASGMPHDGSFDPAQISAPPPSKTESFSKLALPGNKNILIASLNYKSPGNPDYLVEFGQLLDPVDTMLDHLLLQLILGLPLAVIIITAGGYLLVQRALKPVEQITRAAERITQHNLSDRLPIAQTGDEMERLSVSLNRMIARLDDAFQHSKRFVADASHELRTPLTILRGELENMAEDTRVDGEVRERAASMLEEAVHLSKIVEQLFTLSRLDAGEAQAEWTRFDLSELAKTTADQLSLLAEDKGISIVCDASQPMPVEGDRVRLKQVVVNLLDNAIKYTPEKGSIKLRVHGVNGHVMLEVEDNGIGIPPDALPYVFERFYRVDQMRTDGSESAGLGLSIVKSICAAHGAEVEANSVPGQGSCFCVRLPLSKN
ncbi:MAG: HAMP domain-containing sensor histidine kinase [Verrucomicrobiae bacterium]|nr:HAMP domain-containing sensor histidine kinase [Verrucomicrobiae bacterium]